MWAIVALASAACFGIVSVIDKRLLDHHLPSVSVLFLWIAIVLSFYLVIVLAAIGIPQDPPVDALLMGLASGLSTGAGLALMFAGLKQDEASRAIAITQINPIFVALLALRLNQPRARLAVGSVSGVKSTGRIGRLGHFPPLCWTMKKVSSTWCM